MKIVGFGDTRATAYLFGTLQAADDWTTARPSVVVNVGGSDGAFDFWADDGNPVAPMTVSKSFTLYASYTETVDGTGQIELDASTVTGTGTAFLSEIMAGDLITFSVGTLTVASVASDTELTVALTGEAEATDPEDYTITRSRSGYTVLDTVIDRLRLATIAVGKSKLWGEMRDGTSIWCWAKCITLNVSSGISDRLSTPVELEFFCQDGLWYGATAHEFVADGTTNNYNATQSGNYPAAVTVDAVNTSGSMSNVAMWTGALRLNWIGTATVGQHLIVTSRPNSVKVNGVGDFAGVTYYNGANDYDPWLTVNPTGTTYLQTGDGGVTFTSVTFTWYDTYLL